MSTKISFNAFSLGDIQRAKQQIIAYRKNLIAKCERFVKELANRGILVAQENVDEEFGQLIMFSVETDPNQYGCKAVMFGTNTGVIKSRWQGVGGITIEADVSPLLMAEFGSGLRAQRSSNEWASRLGYGTGTFPDQTHAWDPNGWWYKATEEDGGEWHHSYGVYATMPMWHALDEMKEQVVEVAREVFGS